MFYRELIAILTATIADASRMNDAAPRRKIIHGYVFTIFEQFRTVRVYHIAGVFLRSSEGRGIDQSRRNATTLSMATAEFYQANLLDIVPMAFVVRNGILLARREFTRYTW
jgi:hypothetical protein